MPLREIEMARFAATVVFPSPAAALVTRIFFVPFSSASFSSLVLTERMLSPMAEPVSFWSIRTSGFLPLLLFLN